MADSFVWDCSAIWDKILLQLEVFYEKDKDAPLWWKKYLCNLG